jgi:hypothetical protein
MDRRSHFLLAIAVLASGCGTMVYDNVVIVTVSDPSHRLGTAPLEVSVFDKTMGYGKDWVATKMGLTSEAKPYTATLVTSGAATIFDPPRPKSIVVSIAIPALESRGYYILSLEPASRPSGEERAWFTEYGSFFPTKDASSVPVRYKATPEPKGWRLQLDFRIPPNVVSSPGHTQPAPGH